MAPMFRFLAFATFLVATPVWGQEFEICACNSCVVSQGSVSEVEGGHPPYVCAYASGEALDAGAVAETPQCNANDFYDKAQGEDLVIRAWKVFCDEKCFPQQAEPSLGGPCTVNPAETPADPEPASADGGGDDDDDDELDPNSSEALQADQEAKAQVMKGEGMDVKYDTTAIRRQRLSASVGRNMAAAAAAAERARVAHNVLENQVKRSENAYQIAVATENIGTDVNAEVEAASAEAREEAEKAGATYAQMQALSKQVAADARRLAEKEIAERVAEPAKRMAKANAYMWGWDQPPNYPKMVAVTNAKPYLAAMSDAIARVQDYSGLAQSLHKKALGKQSEIMKLKTVINQMETHGDMIGVEEASMKMKDLWADAQNLQAAAEANQKIAADTRKTIPEFQNGAQMAAAYSAYQYTHTFTAPPDMALMQMSSGTKVQKPAPLVLSRTSTTSFGSGKPDHYAAPCGCPDCAHVLHDGCSDEMDHTKMEDMKVLPGIGQAKGTTSAGGPATAVTAPMDALRARTGVTDAGNAGPQGRAEVLDEAEIDNTVTRPPLIQRSGVDAQTSGGPLEPRVIANGDNIPDPAAQPDTYVPTSEGPVRPITVLEKDHTKLRR